MTTSSPLQAATKKPEVEKKETLTDRVVKAAQQLLNADEVEELRPRDVDELLDNAKESKREEVSAGMGKWILRLFTYLKHQFVQIQAPTKEIMYYGPVVHEKLSFKEFVQHDALFERKKRKKPTAVMYAGGFGYIPPAADAGDAGDAAVSEGFSKYGEYPNDDAERTMVYRFVDLACNAKLMKGGRVEKNILKGYEFLESDWGGEIWKKYYDVFKSLDPKSDIPFDGKKYVQFKKDAMNALRNWHSGKTFKGEKLPKYHE